MSLATYVPETATVKGKNYELQVRGLNMNDISSLLRTHLSDLENVFEMYEKQGADGLSNIALGRFAIKLVQDAPGLVAHCIALAADEREFVENAARLPFLAQIECLKKIGTLTFEEVGGVKKLLDSINHLVASLRPPAPDSRPPAPDSSQPAKS